MHRYIVKFVLQFINDKNIIKVLVLHQYLTKTPKLPSYGQSSPFYSPPIFSVGHRKSKILKLIFFRWGFYNKVHHTNMNEIYFQYVC